MPPLPQESEDDLRNQATIGPADIAKAEQMVRKLAGPVQYQDGKEIKTVRAEKVRPLWEAESE